MRKKIDNHSLGCKVWLRKYFLDKYHPDGFVVLDGFRGSGKIWRQLRFKSSIDYWGVDVKRARGRVKIESERILARDGYHFDVVDLDAYGSPWTHFINLVEHCKNDVTVFLTVACLRTGGGSKLDLRVSKILNLDSIRMKIPLPIAGGINHDSTEIMLGVPLTLGWKIRECLEAVPFETGNARYFGMRLEREGSGTVV